MDYRDWEDVGVHVLIGKTLTSIDRGEDELTFHTEDGEEYQMQHDQSCCESVNMEDVCGDLDDLIGSPIVMAEGVESDEPDEAIKAEREKQKQDWIKKNPGFEYYPYEPDSETWTFYKFATVKGSVTLRWYGSSNGYYSESVDFKRRRQDGEKESDY